MAPVFDVVIAGGSLAGLLAAREVAEGGRSVAVLEDDLQVGQPEKCDGLVSAKALHILGVVPNQRLVQSEIQRAVLWSPGGISLQIDARRQKVVVLDRSEFDKEIARQACALGADIRLGARVNALTEDRGEVIASTAKQRTTGSYAIDARGCSSLISQGRRDMLQAARFEVHAPWIEEGTVELYFDQKTTPGFFTWIIPTAGDTAKVGAAGVSVNPFRVVEGFLAEKGRHSVVKKTAAQLVVGGPIQRFVQGRVLRVGDAAGQCKPTTAGGIFSGGMGGLLAGQASARALAEENPSELHEYEAAWRRMFGDEFRMMLLARRIFEKLSNEQLDDLFRAVGSSQILQDVAEHGDFDRHSLALVRALGARRVLSLIRLIAASEAISLRPLLGSGLLRAFASRKGNIH